MIPIVALLLAATVGHAGDVPSFSDVQKTVEAALKSEDPAVRARAFDVLMDCKDPRGADLILASVKWIKRSQDKVRREQGDVEKLFEGQFTKKVKLDKWFENSSRSSKDLDRYNKEARKITKKLNLLTLKLKSLENDYTRASAQLDAAVQAMGRVVQLVETESLKEVLDLLDVQWRNGRSTEAQLWWIDTLASVDRPSIISRVRKAVGDPDMPVDVRAAALQTLGAKKDVTAFDLALKYIENPGAPWDMRAASIQVLKLLREKRSILPLITFLGEDGIKRLREDAHEALKALTGEKHGPYQGPWKRWWEDRGDTFKVPAVVASGGVRPAPGEGVTFYGVHTFSDRVLFILDVSGSMDQVPKGDGPKKPKIDVARKELIGAIDLQNDGYTFNVIFFNHEVVPWQTKMIESSDATRRRARKWVEKQDPQGGTNIYDALEAGFGLALKATGEPIIDTIFFLTDGRPTAGKIQNRDQILEHVAEWNRTARIKIHAIGVGNHDQEFMERLAKIGGGTYVRK